MYGRNPFEDEDDEYSFASQAKKNNAITTKGSGFKQSLPNNPFEDEEGEGTFGFKKNPQQTENPVASRQMLIQNSMNRQLESTTRCLATIYDTEAVGIATAEELINQGEKLDNVERNLDIINDKTKESQKHLNNIKSVFGSFKNWLSGDNKKQQNTTTISQSNRDRSNTTLSKALDSSSSTRDDHPTVKSKSYDVKGFYETDVVEFKDYDTDNMSRSSSTNQVGSLMGHTTKASDWKEYERGLDNNLNLMSNGLSNLKNLALGLGEEIETQNQQLDRINNKVDRSDAKIRNQNMQMKSILGK